MKPVSRKSLHSSNFLSNTLNLDFGSLKTVAAIKGSVKKIGQNYHDAAVILFNKSDFQVIAIQKPDALGNYHFLGLNKSINCFVVGFDINKQYNAVIQDNVVPK